MKKVAVVLAGCGNKDGSEIHESVCTLIAICQAGAEYKCFAPNVEYQALDFLTGKQLGKRKTLVEAARIARSQIKDIHNLVADNFDALVFPGGLGAATQLSNWLLNGARADVHAEVPTLTDEPALFYPSC